MWPLKGKLNTRKLVLISKALHSGIYVHVGVDHDNLKKTKDCKSQSALSAAVVKDEFSTWQCLHVYIALSVGHKAAKAACRQIAVVFPNFEFLWIHLVCLMMPGFATESLQITEITAVLHGQLF